MGLSLATAPSLCVVPSVRAEPIVSGGEHGEIIERIVAIINGEPLLLSELRTRATPFLPRLMQAPSEVQRMTMMDQLYAELLTQLIDERLLEQEARKLSVAITSSDIEH